MNHETDDAGSLLRYRKRLEAFDAAQQPRWRHSLWWFLHNTVAHPCIGAFPAKWSFAFHDYTSRKINEHNGAQQDGGPS